MFRDQPTQSPSYRINPDTYTSQRAPPQDYSLPRSQLGNYWNSNDLQTNNYPLPNRPRNFPSQHQNHRQRRLPPIQSSQLSSIPLSSVQQPQNYNRHQEKIQENLSILQKRPDDRSFQANRNKFYGNDEDELPFNSQLVQVNSSNRLAKTNVKNVSHDPITGALRKYNRSAEIARSLGSGMPEYNFPGKIYDLQPSVESYRPPEYGKKIPRFRAFNPLIHQETNYAQFDYSTYGSAMRNNSSNRVLQNPKVETARSIVNEKPIFKGMGYKKSNIFS